MGGILRIMLAEREGGGERERESLASWQCTCYLPEMIVLDSYIPEQDAGLLGDNGTVKSAKLPLWAIL